jgi:hypothetical protein
MLGRMAESLESLVELVKFGQRLNLVAVAHYVAHALVVAVAHFVAHAHFVADLV